jgi:hypothetical protein
MPDITIPRAQQAVTGEVMITEDVQMNTDEDEIEAQVNEVGQEANGEANQELKEENRTQAILDLSEEVENRESDDE